MIEDEADFLVPTIVPNENIIWAWMLIAVLFGQKDRLVSDNQTSWKHISQYFLEASGGSLSKFPHYIYILYL